MKIITSTWNLVIGSICLFIVLIDLTFNHINWITVLNTFAATINIGWYIVDRTLIDDANVSGEEQ